MSLKKPTRSTTQSKQKTTSKNAPSSAETARSVYVDFVVWDSTKRPMWHPIKKMRYVFFRMMNGCTITDALKEIRWSASEFWHLLDQGPNKLFRAEFQRARILQGRAFGDSVVMIAEGRDRTTRQSMIKVRKLIKTTMRHARRQKSPLAAKAILEGLLARLDENDTKIIARNKLQIDSAKWLAKTANPSEFSEKASLSVDGGSAPSGESKPILVQFIGPDGRPVSP